MSEELRSIPPQHGSFVFTSESVTEGHPDKIADQISDAVLDAILAKEIELQEQGYIAPNGVPANVENVRCACETLVTTGTVIVAGEIRTQAYVDVQEIARGVIRRIGYNRAKFGFDCDTCGVMSLIHEQSPDIAQGVDESFETQTGATSDPIDLIGAGDQGMMFGYASNETKTLMPMPHYLASRLAERLAAVRHDGTLAYLRPDGKTQVTVRYEDGKPVEVTTIVISTQHAAEIEDMGKIKADLIEHVITPVMAAENMPWDNADIYVNPTGRFVVGGPMGDTGLTGRKIIVDTYGGYGRHGGGAHAHSLHHAAVAHGKHAAVIGEVDDGVGAVAGAHRGRQLLGLAQQHIGRIGAGLNALGRHAAVAVPGQRHGGAGQGHGSRCRQGHAAGQQAEQCRAKGQGLCG